MSEFETAQAGRNIILLSDGTGNSSLSFNKTNVWRIFTTLDLGPGSNQIAYYDDGVGTSGLKWLRALGGGFGWGLSRNVRQMYAFLCRHYQPNDRITSSVSAAARSPRVCWRTSSASADSRSQQACTGDARRPHGDRTRFPARREAGLQELPMPLLGRGMAVPADRRREYSARSAIWCRDGAWSRQTVSRVLQPAATRAWRSPHRVSRRVGCGRCRRPAGGRTLRPARQVHLSLQIPEPDVLAACGARLPCSRSRRRARDLSPRALG